MRIPVAFRCCLLLALLAVAASPATATPIPQDGPHGVWNGSFNAQGQVLDIVVTLSNSGGTWSGTIDIPAQSLTGFPLGDIVYAAGSITFAMPGIPGDPVFVGTWDSDAATIEGDLEQGGSAFPFQLSRTGDAPAAAGTTVDAATAEKAVGTWAGDIDTGNGTLRVIMHLEYADGALTGTMDSPDQGQAGLPISSIAFDGSTLRIDLTYASAYFEGALEPDGQSFKGAWNQAGGQAGLILTKQ